MFNEVIYEVAHRFGDELLLWDVWGRSGDKEIDALYQKGLALMNFGAAGDAIKIFTVVINRKPEFAEGWNKRATIYYSVGEYEKSLHDCDEVLKRNPIPPAAPGL